MPYILILTLLLFLTLFFFIRKALQQKKKSALLRRLGQEGESNTAEILSNLDPDSYLVAHDLMLSDNNGHTVQIDHLVITDHTLYVIETKSHVGAIYGSEHSQYWKQYSGNYRKVFYNPLLQNDTHIRFLRSLLSAYGLWHISIVSIIVFTRASSLEIAADDIIKKRTLLPNKDIHCTVHPWQEYEPKWWQFWKKGRRVVLDPEKLVVTADWLLDCIEEEATSESRQAHQIHSAIMSHNIDSPELRKQHTDNARKAAASAESMIRKGLCPRCGAKLRLIKTKNGSFYGCTNYPSCRFTTPV